MMAAAGFARVRHRDLPAALPPSMPAGSSTDAVSFPFSRVVFVLMRGGLLGHIERTVPLPPWLAVFFRLGDMLLATAGGADRESPLPKP